MGVSPELVDDMCAYASFKLLRSLCFFDLFPLFQLFFQLVIHLSNMFCRLFINAVKRLRIMKGSEEVNLGKLSIPVSLSREAYSCGSSELSCYRTGRNELRHSDFVVFVCSPQERRPYENSSCSRGPMK